MIYLPVSGQPAGVGPRGKVGERGDDTVQSENKSNAGFELIINRQLATDFRSPHICVICMLSPLVRHML